MKSIRSAVMLLFIAALILAGCGQASEPPTLAGGTSSAAPSTASSAGTTSAAPATSTAASAAASSDVATSSAAASAASGSANAATGSAVELRMTWYDDGKEGEIMRELLNRFEQENPGIKVVMDTIAYKDLHNILQAQVEAGTPPDLARITDAPRFAGKYLDMRQHMTNADEWAANWTDAKLQYMRAADDKQGLYGFPMQYTLTGMFVNRTLFQQADVPVPSDVNPQATWQEWVDAGKKVAEATQTPYAVSIDRTGHRFWPVSLSMCADYIDDAGTKFTVDTPGFRKAADMLVSWHKDKLAPLEVWAGGGGGYAAANEYFVNGQSVWYFSGSWQVGQFAQQIGDKFEWDVVPTPGGECGTTGIPGGASIVAFNTTKHPEEVTRLVEFMTQEDVLEEFSKRSLFLPAHLGLVKKGMEYPANSKQLNAFLAQVPNITPEANALAVHPLTFTLNTAIRDRLSQVIVGEITLDDAIVKIQQAVDEAQAAQQ